MLAWLLALIIPFVLPLLDTPVVHAPSSRPTLFQAASASTPVVLEQAQTQPETPQWILRNKAVLRAAQQALTQLPELQGAPIQIYEQINFFDGTRPRIEIDLQDPKQPENILYYTYENRRHRPSVAAKSPKRERRRNPSLPRRPRLAAQTAKAHVAHRPNRCRRRTLLSKFPCRRQRVGI